MRRNVTALLLAFGVVAGFGSGIASCARGHDRSADRGHCQKHQAHQTRGPTTAPPPTTTEPAPPPPDEPPPPPAG